MRGAFQIARFFDIPVRIHWSFFLLVAYVGVTSHSQGDTWQDTAWTFLFVAAIFTCVVLHEFGHALAARHYGVPTKDIILSPIGGIARLHRLPDHPGQELAVAVAGPMVNVALALLLGPLVWWIAPDELSQLTRLLMGRPLLVEGSSSFLPYFLPALFLLNIVLAGFNLLPAFPMDGGRIFRALLSLRLHRLKATRIASRTGQVLAAALAIFGILSGNVVTALIGVFIFFMAAREYKQASMEHLLNTRHVASVMDTTYTALQLDDPMQRALEAGSQTGESEFLVFEGSGNWAGTLSLDTGKKPRKSPAQGDTLILNHYKPVWTGLTKANTLQEAIERMYLTDSSILPVFAGSEIIGVVRMDALQNLLRQPIKVA